MSRPFSRPFSGLSARLGADPRSTPSADSLARTILAAACVAVIALPLTARAEPGTVRDLEALSPVTLTKDDLKQLMPGARIARVSARGSDQNWTNDSDGTMVVHSDNRMTAGTRSSTSSKWHISEDGRYCVLIPWRQIPAEEWCRYVIKTTDGYYTAKTTDSGAEKVWKVEIKK